LQESEFVRRKLTGETGLVQRCEFFVAFPQDQWDSGSDTRF
jgi:hypothetical protein